MAEKAEYGHGIHETDRPFYAKFWGRNLRRAITTGLIAVLPGTFACAEGTRSKSEERANSYAPPTGIPSANEFFPPDSSFVDAVHNQPKLEEVAYYWYGKYNEEKDITERVADSLYVPEGVILPEERSDILARIRMGDIPGRDANEAGEKAAVVSPYHPNWKKHLAFPQPRGRPKDHAILNALKNNSPKNQKSF